MSSPCSFLQKAIKQHWGKWIWDAKQNVFITTYTQFSWKFQRWSNISKIPCPTCERQHDGRLYDRVNKSSEDWTLV